jgi:ribosomal-protein-alanine N-acetyltransferase
MTEKDIDKVLSIEKRVFKHPWSREFFHLIISDMYNCMLTLRSDADIIGYGGYHLLKNRTSFLSTRHQYDRMIHLINIAIVPQQQHSGFGTFLMNTLIRKALASKAEYCYLEVRPKNENAFSFYRKWGFSIIGIIENYYPQECENALVMGMELCLPSA